MNDSDLIQAFVQQLIQGKPILLANSHLKAESISNRAQLWAKTEGPIAVTNIKDEPRSIFVRQDSEYTELIHQTLLAESFFPVIDNIQKQGFDKYQYETVPEGYQLHYLEAKQFWKAWWQYYKRKNRSIIDLELLIFTRGKWYPAREVALEMGMLYIKTLGDELQVPAAQKIVWLQKIKENVEEDPSENSASSKTQANNLWDYWHHE
jgi:hypothetical protein